MDTKTPEIIYLQLEDHYGDSLEFEDGVTWCWERINESDVAYVLRSERDALLKRLEAAEGCARALEAEDNCNIYWADGYVPSDEDDIDGEERYNRIYGRYASLTYFAKKQALAAWRAAEGE